MPGCKKEEIKVYRIAREDVAVPAPSQAAAESPHQEGHQGHAESHLPQLKFTAPKGWQQHPGEGMRLVSFTKEGPGRSTVEISVIPLQDITGREADLVNMWRGQLKLQPLPIEGISTQAQQVQIGTNQGRQYEIAGAATEGGSDPQKMLLAVLEADSNTWLFRLSGSPAAIVEEKGTFSDFLKSISFEAPPASLARVEQPQTLSTNPKEPPPGELPRPVWSVPKGWQETDGGPMLFAKYIVPGREGSNTVNISSSLGAAGGVAANVNRWRNQLRLQPLPESEAESSAQPFPVEAGSGKIVELKGTDVRSGQPAQLVAVFVPQGGQTWIYRFMGSEQVIEAQKEQFIQFVRTVKYRHVP